MMISRLAAAALLFVTGACSYSYDAPQFGRAAPLTSFAARPAIVELADNPASPAKLALGARLFVDPALSGDGATACTGCHDPARGFADGRPRSRGADGALLVRHTPGLINVGYAPSLFWDGRSPGLEDQALRPITGGGEMARHPAVLVDAVDTPSYRVAFAAAFPGEGVTEGNIARALAAYERSLVSGVSPFDRFVAGDRGAISSDAVRGFVLFTGRANCAACHRGWLLSDGRFHDVGLADDDLGRGGITGNPAFDHAFRTPSLREIGRSAPYMHDGSLPTLAAVVDHYAGKAMMRANTPPRITLTAAEKRDLVAFLHTLDSDAP